MSSTRYAQAGAPLRPERFASSYERGLLANLVALRAAEIDPAPDRAALWFVQWRSWQPRGLAALSAALVERYDAKALFPEADARYYEEEFPDAEKRRSHYPAACERELSRLCLDPQFGLGGLWEAVDGYRETWIAERAKGVVTTAVGRQVADALDYTRSARTLTLVDGPSRTGKTFAARAWCEQSAGLARYVQVPCSNDDRALYAAIAEALGMSHGLTCKANEIRYRIEETLAGGDLLLVLDEAHYLWPQNWQRFAMPSRVNWVLTALVNRGVPVALVTTPQFYDIQTRVEKLTGWNSAQFLGRIGHVERLPESLGIADLMKVAGALLPECEKRIHAKLAAYAQVSKKHLASIDAIVKRARWLASKEGLSQASAAHVDRAINESVIPSDSALAVSLRRSAKPAKLRDALPPREAFAVSPPSRRGVAAEALSSAGSRLPALATHL